MELSQFWNSWFRAEQALERLDGDDLAYAEELLRNAADEALGSRSLDSV